nr:hypothetical protein [Klebsiella quasipneumoniae]
METEATGAPQKHHYTLNQQVGSITVFSAAYTGAEISAAPNSKDEKILTTRRLCIIISLKKQPALT